MYKDLNKSKIFDNVNLGFEFEFFSPIPREELAEKLKTAIFHIHVFQGTARLAHQVRCDHVQ